MKILLTGGTGFIGSHTALQLVDRGHDVVLFDNLENSSVMVVDRLNSLKTPSAGEITFIHGSILDGGLLRNALNGIDAVIHFAGLKAVADSWVQPLDYYRTNVAGTQELLAAMRDVGLSRLVFSSSASVYGDASSMPVSESSMLSPMHPYGRSKRMAEEMIRDFCEVSGASSVLLRYFNPVGAHPSGMLGEDPRGRPNNLMPILTQIAVGRLPALQINGTDYETPDGTCIRDYLHVMDVASAHVLAVESEAPSTRAYNLGSGRGISILEFIAAFESASGQKIPLTHGPRRRGDVPELWADASLANAELGWSASLSLAQMCEDAWRWQSMNPNGYAVG